MGRSKRACAPATVDRNRAGLASKQNCLVSLNSLSVLLLVVVVGLLWWLCVCVCVCFVGVREADMVAV
jgi:hypothetical protein